jgi:F-type H+-transporting ATPase subunit b
MINFLVFVVVINYLLVKPILRVLDERRNRVEGNEEEAERLLAESERILDEYETTLKEARIEASGEKERMKSEGLEKETEIIKIAKEESKKITDRLKEEIAKETETALSKMKGEADVLSKVIAEKILEREV